MWISASSESSRSYDCTKSPLKPSKSLLGNLYREAGVCYYRADIFFHQHAYDWVFTISEIVIRREHTTRQFAYFMYCYEIKYQPTTILGKYPSSGRDKSKGNAFSLSWTKQQQLVDGIIKNNMWNNVELISESFGEILQWEVICCVDVGGLRADALKQ